MTSGLYLGYDGEGRAVRVPLTHIVVSAITGGGKTEAVRRLASEACLAGSTVLAIDVKAKPRDFAGFGPEIRPFILENTEPLLVLRLLESTAGTSLFRHFNVLLDACMDTSQLRQVLANLETTRDNKKASSWKREGAKTLAYMLQRLLEQIRSGNYAQDLVLRAGEINVMDVSGLPEGVQQLVVDSAFRRLLTGKWKDVLVVLEEALRFMPQSEAREFETSAARFVREGRSAGLFLLASGQALTEINVHVRKQFRAWVLGPQAEENEADKFRRQVPMKGVTTHDIMQLPTGWFYCAIRGEDRVEVHRVYAHPTWLPTNIAIDVARGKVQVSEVQKHKPKRREGKDVDDKERAEYEKTIDVLRREISRLTDKLAMANTYVEQEPDPPPPSPAPRTSTPPLPTRASPEWSEMDPDDRIRAIVRDELRQAGTFRVLEAAAPRVILKGFAADAVQRTREKLGSLSERQKRILAYLAAKKVGLRTTAIWRSLFGYDNPSKDQLAELRALLETGLVRYHETGRTYTYAGPEFVKSLGSQYDLLEQDVEEAIAAIEQEFARVSA